MASVHLKAGVHLRARVHPRARVCLRAKVHVKSTAGLTPRVHLRGAPEVKAKSKGVMFLVNSLPEVMGMSEIKGSSQGYALGY